MIYSTTKWLVMATPKGILYLLPPLTPKDQSEQGKSAPGGGAAAGAHAGALARPPAPGGARDARPGAPQAGEGGESGRPGEAETGERERHRGRQVVTRPSDGLTLRSLLCFPAEDFKLS